MVLIPLNICLEIPKSAFTIIAPRSSTHKLGITAANGIGIGDSDYCGDSDEYKFAALNFTNNDVTIQRGARIAQITVVSYSQVLFEEVDNFQNKDRGGFGSTGLN